MNRFMDKEWEDRQLEKLKALQEERIAQLKTQVEGEAMDIKKNEPPKANENL